MPPSTEEVQLLYERVERLAEQASIAEQLQRENDDLRAEVQELRGAVRALRRENTALHSNERVDTSDMVPHCLRLALDYSTAARVPQRCHSRQGGCVCFATRSQTVTNSVLTALHESELAQQTNREALIALRRHHAAQLAERDVEIGRLQYVASTILTSSCTVLIHTHPQTTNAEVFNSLRISGAGT